MPITVHTADCSGSFDPSCTVVSVPRRAKNRLDHPDDDASQLADGEEHEIKGVVAFDPVSHQFAVEWKKPGPKESPYDWVNASDLNPAAWNAWQRKLASYTEDRESHERPDRLFILDKILMEDKATDEVRVSFISTGADGRPYGDEWLFRSGIKTQECLDEWDMLLKCDASFDGRKVLIPMRECRNDTHEHIYRLRRDNARHE